MLLNSHIINMKLSYPTVRLIHGRRTTGPKSVLSTVELEISYKGKRKWISTGIRVRPVNWKTDKGVVGLPNSQESNMRISHCENIVKRHLHQLMIDQKPFSWKELDRAIESMDDKKSFTLFVKERVETRKDIKESTRRNHRKFQKAMEDFNVICRFDDLTKANIEKYDQWLRSRKDYCQSTIASYHKYMKVYINDAIKMELIQKNPYDGYKVNQGKSRIRKYLTPEELVKIESCVLPTQSLNKVRDVFIFQCYTGLSYSDLKRFDFRNVIVRNGRNVVHDVRQKTGEDYYIVLLPKAMSVLQKYDFILPVMTNEQYNMRLKLVAEYAKVLKNLTSHMGRHTYATHCLNSGVQIEVLAQMLGHSDIKTTQIYAKLINLTVEDSYDMLAREDNVVEMIHCLNRLLEAFSMLLH